MAYTLNASNPNKSNGARSPKLADDTKHLTKRNITQKRKNKKLLVAVNHAPAIGASGQQRSTP